MAIPKLPANGAQSEAEGLVFYFIPRRSQFDCNVYRDGLLVAELAYPKIHG